MQKRRSFQYSCVIQYYCKLQQLITTVDSFYSVFQGLTLDVIARTAFGYETSVQSNPNDKLLELCREMLGARRNLFSRVMVQLLGKGSMILQAIHFQKIFHTFHLSALSRNENILVIIFALDGKVAKTSVSFHN